MSNKVDVITCNLPEDLFTRCPLCNQPIIDSVIIIKSDEHTRLTLAHKFCLSDFQNNPQNYVA